MARTHCSLERIVLIEINNPSALLYALDLSRVLKLPIVVYTGSKKLPPETINSEELRETQQDRVQSLIPGAQVVVDLSCDPKSIIVSNRLARIETSGRSRKGMVILAPQSEESFDPYDKKKILVPIGRVETAIKALGYAVAIAKSTESSLVLYHTTRPLAGCDSLSWRNHMHENAREMLEVAKRTCDEEGVDFEEDITSVYPDLICSGITAAAFAHNCFLIVMAIAKDVVFGSNATQVLDLSPIPTLVVE